MTRYTLRALAAQWRAWSGTVAVLALAAGLINVCLVHRMTVTRPDVVAAGPRIGDDVGAVITAAKEYADAGFTHLALVQIGGDAQEPYLEWSRETLMPAWREALEASGRQVWLATQVLEDPDGDHDWRLTALVDLAECDREGRAVVHLLSVGPQQG